MLVEQIHSYEIKNLGLCITVDNTSIMILVST